MHSHKFQVFNITRRQSWRSSSGHWQFSNCFSKSTMGGEVATGGFPKPLLRGLHNASIRRNLIVSGILVTIVTIAVKFARNDPRKADYAEFYKWVLSLRFLGRGSFEDYFSFLIILEPTTPTSHSSVWWTLDLLTVSSQWNKL